MLYFIIGFFSLIIVFFVGKNSKSFSEKFSRFLAALEDLCGSILLFSSLFVLIIFAVFLAWPLVLIVFSFTMFVFHQIDKKVIELEEEKNDDRD